MFCTYDADCEGLPTPVKPDSRGNHAAISPRAHITIYTTKPVIEYEIRIEPGPDFASAAPVPIMRPVPLLTCQGLRENRSEFQLKFLDLGRGQAKRLGLHGSSNCNHSDLPCLQPTMQACIWILHIIQPSRLFLAVWYRFLVGRQRIRASGHCLPIARFKGFTPMSELHIASF